MFAIMYETTENGKIFKICETLDEARNKAHNIACMGYSVTVFDYDVDTGTYIEFYTI